MFPYERERLDELETIAREGAKAEGNEDYSQAARMYRSLADSLAAAGGERQAAHFYVEAAVDAELADEIRNAGDAHATAGALFWRLEEHSTALDAFNEAIDRYAGLKDYDSLAHCCGSAGEVALEGGYPLTAALLFDRAATAMKAAFPLNQDFIVRRYADSVTAYARAASETKCELAYRKFRDILDVYPYDQKERQYFNQIVSNCQEQGLESLASVVFVDKMRRECRHNTRGITRGLLVLWGMTANYGESWKKSFGTILLVVFAFAFLFYPCPLGQGCFEFDWRGNLQTPVWDAGLTWNALTGGAGVDWGRILADLRTARTNLVVSLELSVNVFCTLGMMDVCPRNPAARIAVCCEVLLGILAVANLGTVIFKQFLRR